MIMAKFWYVCLAFTLMFMPSIVEQLSPRAELNTMADALEPSEDRVDFTKLADKIWMHTSYKNVEPWGLIFTNGLLIERDDHSILVDTAWNDQLTTQVIEWARNTLQKPIQASIHTHAHDDKMGGMKALHQAGIETFASQMSNKIAPKRDLIAANNDLDLGVVRARVTWQGLSIMYPGGGHTQDNIVVYDETSQVIFGGCLIRPGRSKSLGFTGDANLTYWSQAAQNVANAFPDGSTVISSHGKPGGREVLVNTINITKPKAKS